MTLTFQQMQYIIANNTNASPGLLAQECGADKAEVMEFIRDNGLSEMPDEWSAVDIDNLKTLLHGGLTDFDDLRPYLAYRPAQEIKDKAIELDLVEDDGPSVIRKNKFRSGKREDLDDLFVRSSWEANYARYLNWLMENDENCDIDRWEYEPGEDLFTFHKIRKGTRHYLPDFKVYRKDGSVYYVEVKGRMDRTSATKLKRMALYYPEVELELVDKDAYNAIKKNVAHLIPNWE